MTCSIRPIAHHEPQSRQLLRLHCFFSPRHTEDSVIDFTLTRVTEKVARGIEILSETSVSYESSKGTHLHVNYLLRAHGSTLQVPGSWKCNLCVVFEDDFLDFALGCEKLGFFFFLREEGAQADPSEFRKNERYVRYNIRMLLLFHTALLEHV